MTKQEKIDKLAKHYRDSADIETLMSFFYEQQVIYLTDNLSEEELTQELNDIVGYDVDDPDA